MMKDGKLRTTTSRRLKSKGLLSESTKALPKQGVCFKFSPALFAGWQERYLTLNDSILRYYKIKSNGKKVMKGVLNFHLYMATIESGG